MLLCPFFPQFFDNSGAVLAGGKLYTYATGTTTPQTAYQTQAGTAHSNPITLDSAGRVQPALWLSEGVEYRFRIETSASVLVDEWDDIIGVNAGADGTYTASATYANNTVGKKLQEWISVKDYGAKGDGVTDDKASIQSAINDAITRAPCKLVFPEGTYKCDSALGYFTGNDVTIDFNGATLDFSAAATNTLGPLIGFQGTYGSTAALTSNAAADQATLAVTSTGFAVGDWVRIYSSGVWDSARTDSLLGEINVIETVPGGTSVTLVANLESTYTTAQTATLQKLTPCRNVHILNGRFIAPTTDNLYAGVDLKLCVGSSVESMRTLRCDVLHIRLLDCVQSHVKNCDIDESSNTTQAYGISFTDACQDCTAVGNTMRNVRHAFTTNNTTSTSYGITRRCLVANNTVYNNVPNSGGSSGDALDTHAGADQMVFIGNTVHGAYGIGINAECRRFTAVGNSIFGATSAGIRHAPYADYASACLIANNVVEMAGDNTDTNDHGIRVVIPASVLAEMDQCVVQGNRVSSKNAAIQLEGNATYKIINFSVAGNVASLRDGLTGATNTTIDLIYAQHGAVVGNRAKGRNTGINLDNATHVSVTGNSVQINGTTGSTGYGIRTTGTCSYLGITGNTAYYSDTGIVTTVGVSFGGTTTQSGIWNNVTQGFGTNVNAGAGAGVVSANNI